MENSPLLWELVELAGHLRQERLFVQCEIAQIQELNEKVISASSKLAQAAWVTAQQRKNLSRLVLSCPDATPAVCCRKANSLESTRFVDAYKVIGYQNCAQYGQLLSCLRSSPELVAKCLAVGDSLLPDEMAKVVHSLVSGLYASCVMIDDKCAVLKILSHLISLQLAPSDAPRRLLKQGSCAFSRLYSIFHEGLFSAKIFLTAALNSPIRQLLMLEEKYMDIDPEKAAMRLTDEEKVKRYGKMDTDEYKTELEKHREWSLNNLVNITKCFIDSLHENLHCFPSSVCWLVGQIYARLTKSNTIPEKEVFAMCTDLVFTLFVCPAIVTPEPYSIIDAPISSVARFNLIQVAQTIQMLAMRKYEPVAPKMKELYSHFEKSCVSSIIDCMLEGVVVRDDPPVADSIKLDGISRTAALFTESELASLITFLRTVGNESHTEDAKFQKELMALINQLPQQTLNGHTKPAQTSPDHVVPKKPNLLTKNLAKVGRSRRPGGYSSGTENGSPEDEDVPVEKVLVILFDPSNVEHCIGMISEQKVLEMKKEGESERNVRIIEGERAERIEGSEKRTRFSLSHDDGSIGNTSDNLEVVSEAPSNHSVASSLELETEDQNDNLSDMVSANVSGRGSPNISVTEEREEELERRCALWVAGRDTPSSQVTEGDEGAGGQGSGVVSARPQLDFNQPPPPPPKHSRFDIDDKFGKFEIKTLIEGADETVSIVSDTWSTDVLASDSETVEQPNPSQQPPLPLSEPQPLPSQMVDVSETASEAWSTDVMASDSERLTDVDEIDETASVARSDDTARSEVESRGEPETEEPTIPSPMGSGLRVGRDDLVRGSPTRGSGSSSVNSDLLGPRSASKPRKTLEILDTNRNIYKHGAGSLLDDGPSQRLIHVLEKPFGDATKPVLAVPSPGPVVSLAMLTGQGDGVVPVVPVPSHELCGGGSSRSTASVTSTSSSSSSGSESRNANSGPGSVPNGCVVIETLPTVKPSHSSGAIPKSISFDKTAERGDKESLDDEGRGKRGFFRNFKLTFKTRRGKHFRSSDGYDSLADGDGIPNVRFRRGLSEDARPPRHAVLDTEDILAKYRKKPLDGASGEHNGLKRGSAGPTEPLDTTVPLPRASEGAAINPQPLPTAPFEDAKRKVRLVLSMAEIQQVPDMLPAMRQSWMQKENELVAFLQLQLAEAINLQDHTLIPQLHETLRCVKMFSQRECRNLYESLKEDYKSRSPYVTYLVKSRQALLQTLAHLERLHERVKWEKNVVLEYLSSVCVRLFLERREHEVAKFVSEFSAARLSDEKSDILEAYLHSLATSMDSDPIWQCASDTQISQARLAVERTMYSRVYLNAMYPNGDGDLSRDQKLNEHINKLAKILTPDHKYLRIPKIFHSEAPWLSAQAEISQIGCYRTPRDKLHCVLSCITTIINLLSLACVPAADELVPVLVYVLVLANPPSLLSTVEYVTSFYGNSLEGEEQYYWTQFCSAIEFIKTMDYVTD